MYKFQHACMLLHSTKYYINIINIETLIRRIFDVFYFVKSSVNRISDLFVSRSNLNFTFTCTRNFYFLVQ